MNLQQLYYFQKIAECQQYTKAAEELHVTQATLSYAITNLESELKVKLFHRQGKQVVLTACGSVYLSSVRDAIQALDRGARMVRELSAPAKVTIKLGYLESLKQLIPNLIGDLCGGEEGGSLRFDLAHYTAPMIERMLVRREVDLGISTAPMEQGISSHRIGYQENVMVVPKQHPWAQWPCIPLSALEGQRFIAYSRDCTIRSYYDSVLESAHVDPDIIAEARFDSNILDMVSYGMGVAIVPQMKRLERYDLMAVPIGDKIPPRAICLLWAKDAALSPEVDRLRRQIVECADRSWHL